MPRLLIFLLIAVMIYFAGRRWWIAREAAKLTDELEEFPNAIPYFPQERTYGDLTEEQKQQLEKIAPSPSLIASARACKVTLDDETEYACVLIAPAQDHINVTWEWPEDLAGDDPESAPIKIERVVRIEESKYRVPPHIAEQILVHNKADHGGMQVIAEFNNGAMWRYKLQDYPEFLSAPAGLTFADVVAIHPDEGGAWNLPKGRALKFRMCLYGHGMPPANVRIWKRPQA